MATRIPDANIEFGHTATRSLPRKGVKTGYRAQFQPADHNRLCGTPESSIESDLFGHVRDALTGATNVRRGHFLAANTGTIFLDETGERSLGRRPTSTI